MRTPHNIGMFTLYNKKPNTIAKGGHLYDTTMFFDVPNKFKERMVRVYLPSDYEFDNPNKRYPVIYMTDGQNLCDHYLSGYGEWCVDETIEERVKLGKQAFIAVGIDCPKEEFARLVEMSITSNADDMTNRLHNNNGVGYADKLAKFILTEVKPIIDETFFTIDDKAHTAVGGSSMGGLMAYYMGMKYKDIVGYSLCFSPGFLVYKAHAFKRELEAHEYSVDEYGKFFFYVGGKDFEKRFVNLTFYTYNYLTKVGFDDTKLRLVYDSNMIHHEIPWSKYFPFAIEFWLD